MFCKWCGMHIPAGTTKCQNCNREQEALSNGNIFEQIGIDNKVNTAAYGSQMGAPSNARNQVQKEVVKYIETDCTCRKCGRHLTNQHVLCANCYAGEKANQKKKAVIWKRRVATLMTLVFILLGSCIVVSIGLFKKNQLVKNKENQLERMQEITDSNKKQESTEIATTASDTETLTEDETQQEKIEILSDEEWPEVGEQLLADNSDIDTINSIDETAGVYIDYQFAPEGNKYVVEGDKLFQHMETEQLTNKYTVYWYKLLDHNWISISPAYTGKDEITEDKDSLFEIAESEVGDAEIVACYIKTDNHVYRMKRNAVKYSGKYEPDQMSRVKDYLEDARINDIPEVLTDVKISYDKEQQLYEVDGFNLSETVDDTAEYCWYVKKSNSMYWEYVTGTGASLYMNKESISLGDIIVCYIVTNEDVFEVIHEVTHEDEFIISEEITTSEEESTIENETTSEENIITSEEMFKKF